MNRDQQITKIAEAFAEVMKQWLSPAEFAEMKRANETDETYSGGVCASHNFCDANMAMMVAFKDVVGRDPEVENEDDCELWNETWGLARKLYLGDQH